MSLKGVRDLSEGTVLDNSEYIDSQILFPPADTVEELSSLRVPLSERDVFSGEGRRLPPLPLDTGTNVVRNVAPNVDVHRVPVPFEVRRRGAAVSQKVPL